MAPAGPLGNGVDAEGPIVHLRRRTRDPSCLCSPSRFPPSTRSRSAIGPFAIRWYALAYVAGLLRRLVLRAPARRSGRRCGRRLRRPTPQDIDDLVVWAALGVVLGGRIGYVLFYNLDAYSGRAARDPRGLARRHVVPRRLLRRRPGACCSSRARAASTRLAVLDLVAVVAPIGLFFGRIANFINGELWGRAAPDVRLRGGVPARRAGAAPSEPALRGVRRGAGAPHRARRRGAAASGFRRPGLLTGLFALGYALGRIACEFFREPDAQLGFLFGSARAARRRRHHGHAAVAADGCCSGSSLIWLALRGTTQPRAVADAPARVTPLARALARADRRRGADDASRATWRSASAIRGTATTRPATRSARRATSSPRPRSARCSASSSGSGRSRSGSAMGRPRPSRLVELGPGRGTLMADLLRAARVAPAFRAAVAVHLVETSPALRARQERGARRRIGPARLARQPSRACPTGRRSSIANEFFDALPVRQFVRTDDGWRERLVGLDARRRAAPSASRPGRSRACRSRRRRARCWSGPRPRRRLPTRWPAGSPGTAAPRSSSTTATHGPAFGDTLQAVRRHAFADPLAAPGEADLTVHVDFGTARPGGAAPPVRRTFGPMPQGDFLRALGIETRAAALKRRATPAQAAAIDARRCCACAARGDRAMGALFKAFAFAHPACRPCPASQAPAASMPAVAEDRSHADRSARAQLACRRPARLLHPRGRRLRGPLRLAQRRARLGRRSGARRREPAPHDGAARLRPRRRWSACTRCIRPTWSSSSAPGRAASGRAPTRMVTRAPGIALGIATADCGPLLFADPLGQAWSAPRTPAGAARSPAWSRRPWPRWSGSAPSAAGSSPCSARRIGQAAYEVGPEFVARLRGRRSGQRALLRSGRARRPRPVRPARLHRRRGSTAAGVGELRRPRPLHLRRGGALLQLPPRHAPRRAGLRPADLGDRADAVRALRGAEQDGSDRRCCVPLAALAIPDTPALAFGDVKGSPDPAALQLDPRRSLLHPRPRPASPRRGAGRRRRRASGR